MPCDLTGAQPSSALLCLSYFSTLKMEATCSSETAVNCCLTTQRQISHDNRLGFLFSTLNFRSLYNLQLARHIGMNCVTLCCTECTSGLSGRESGSAGKWLAASYSDCNHSAGKRGPWTYRPIYVQPDCAIQSQQRRFSRGQNSERRFWFVFVCKGSVQRTSSEFTLLLVV